MTTLTRDNYQLYFIDFCDGKLTPTEIAELKAFLLKNPDLQDELDALQNINLSLSQPKNTPDFSHLKKNITDVELTPENADELIISFLEGDYPTEKQHELRQWIEQNEKLKAQFDKIAKTKLSAGLLPIDKSSLYRIPDFEKDPVNAGNAEWFAAAMLEGDLSEQAKEKFISYIQKNSDVSLDFSNLKLVADTTIFYPHRQQLKRKSTATLKVFAYSTAVAASILLMVGIFFLLSDKPTVATVEVALSTPVETTDTSTLPTETQSQPLTLVSAEAKTNIARTIERKNRKLEPMKIRTLGMDTLAQPVAELGRSTHEYNLMPAFAYEPESTNDNEDWITENNGNIEGTIPQKNLLGRAVTTLWNYAQNAVSNSRVSENFRIETKRNDDRELIYFSIETPVFAIERKK